MRSTSLLFLAAALSLWALPAKAELIGPAKVIAGDRLEVAGITLRLNGIDAPEPGQICRVKDRPYDCGKVAASALKDLTAGGPVRCLLEAERDSGEMIAVCFAEDYDLSEGMVYTGWALAYPRAESPYRRFEEGARAARRGMWRGDFVAPWEWCAGLRLPEAEEK
ncbi:MAG: thermonuclease family protein [Proteobacteria bacterium]|nr:thermonuclease family protein [Pseudomonadota bacterium]